MIDIYVDDVVCEKITDIKEGYRIDFKNKKDEKLMLVLNEDGFVDLYNRLKRRCEVRNLIPIHNATDNNVGGKRSDEDA